MTDVPAPEERDEDFLDRAAHVLELLVERGESVAVAESLTGGMVAAEFTAAPGSSRAFRGSVTAYATDLKKDLLGVDGKLLAERGAVDEDVARAMAEGVRAALGASWGLSTTGVAGPDPQDGKSVGTVFTAVAGPDGATVCRELDLDGDRAEIRRGSVRGAVALLHDELAGNARRKDKEHDGGNGCLQP
ncbi:CinA family protein [Streptomyces sp. WMMB 322]|uniref:CinA family protein n=1 Tax=Streptomyces sp. WMMB 322 TaxID=1286821 RepID=UPI0006E1F5BF|nr:CinA family protein [Streptomyces sp. WMMB 322]SCK49554.1 nicotinamide-nucleotide amidase [Streptomyces sp. WMMB 322]